MQHRSKLPNVGTTIFAVMSKLAKDYNAINLAQGFPDFECDKKLIDLVYKAMNSGFNQYAPMPGLLALRQAISSKYATLHDTSYHPASEITVTTGATQAIYTGIAAFIRPEDEVLIFFPAYDCYKPAVELHGGKVIPVQLKAPYYQVDWDVVKRAITAKTKMIIINTPQNPSATLFTEADMTRLQEITDGTDIVVLSDEVYEHIVFDGEKHQSACLFPGLKSRTLITASFGKIFHNTGWKMGYCCAPKTLMEEFRKVHQYNVFSVNHPIQVALAEYMKKPSHYLGLSGFFQEKRDLFLTLIKNSRFKFVPSKGSYFQVLDYSEISHESDHEFAKKMTIEKGLASIPMSVFNQNQADHKVLRFCFAKKDDTLKRAAEIICAI